MHRFVFVFLLYLGLGTLTALGQDSSISSAKISFEFVSKGVKGSISGFKSESNINLSDLRKSVFKGSVSSKTLDTNNGLRNWSLRSGKYFDVDDYPRISFEGTEVSQNGNEWIVKGKLTIKSTTKSVSMIFVKKGERLVGTFSLYSIDYGIKIKKKREDNLVKVLLEFELD
nr:YceI family protein [Allomuricauda sp.]